MKIRVNALAFHNSMVHGARLAPNKATHETLRHVKIEADKDGRVVVTGSDLTTTIRHYIDGVEVIEPGSILVPGAKLLKVLKGMGDEEVALTVGAGLRCVVTAATAHFKIAGGDPADYPDLPVWSDEDSFTVKAEDLMHMVNRVHVACASEMGRWAMNGVRIEMHKHLLRVVATDGRRVAMADREGVYPGEIATTVPKEGLLLLPNLLLVDDTVLVKMDDVYLHIRGSGMELMVRRLTGNFPPYEHVIPLDNPIRVEFNRKEFIKTLQRAMLLISKSSKAVRFIFSADGLEVESWAERTEEAHVSHPIVWPHEEKMVIGYDPYHLLEGVASLRGASFTLEIRDETSPAVMRESNDGMNHLYLIVPVNLPH